MANGIGNGSRYGAAALHKIAILISPPELNLEQVLAWSEKTTYLRIALSDLPGQLAEAQTASEGLGEQHSESDVRLFNALPTLRLAMTLELTAHIVYSLTEVAANVARKVTARSRNGLPGSFNDIRKAVDAGSTSPALVEALGDLSWYKKVREMRTEWAHYSAPFVAAGRPQPEFRVYAQRPTSERKHLQEPALFTFDEYVGAVRGAVSATEGLAHFIIVEHILPKLDRNATRTYLTRTPDGFPIIRGGKMALEDKTIGDLLLLCGIDGP